MAKDAHRNDETPHKERLKEATRKYNDRQKGNTKRRKKQTVTGKKA